MGKVIGRSGVRIDTLAKMHSCELKMRRELAMENGDTPLDIQSLRGSFVDVLAAERDIHLIVSVYKLQPLPKKWFFKAHRIIIL
jgi:hypothetical protein